MTTTLRQTKFRGRTARSLQAVLGVLLLTLADTPLYAQEAQQQAAQPEQAAAKIPNDQLDALVAPIALYPDPLLSQVLVASTYPLEIIQLQQWLAQHPDLKDQALTDAVEAQDWDPSIQSMAVLPDAVKQLAENIKWTTDLGNAFLAQQSDVMDAVQRMRTKAMDAGNLKSTEQQQVETKVVETKTVVIIQQADPQIVYVPSYSPVVVYGPPVYPYPPIVYPPPSYYAGAAIAFGVGIAIGAAYHNGGWGYNCGWGNNHNDVNINVNNNYVRNSNINKANVNNANRNGSNTWQHNPQHRGGTPYSNKATANKYGGTARGDSMSTRQASARQQQGASSRQQGASANSRQQGANSRQQSTASNRSAAGTNRTGSNASASNRSATGTNRADPNASANRGGSGGNNVGNRQVQSRPSNSTNAFGGASSRSSARASGSRGASSMGSSRGGGGGRSGGGRRG
jgi:hypothetical protein